MIWNILFVLANQYGKFIEISEKRRLKKSGKGTRKLPGHSLYHFYASPYSRTVRDAVFELGLDFPFYNILGDKHAFSELVNLGGHDMSPCLRIQTGHGDQWMYESQDIIAYLKTK